MTPDVLSPDISHVFKYSVPLALCFCSNGFQSSSDTPSNLALAYNIIRVLWCRKWRLCQWRWGPQREKNPISHCGHFNIYRWMWEMQLYRLLIYNQMLLIKLGCNEVVYFLTRALKCTFLLSSHLVMWLNIYCRSHKIWNVFCFHLDVGLNVTLLCYKFPHLTCSLH